MPSFSIDEIYEMACGLERNGAAYYARAAELAAEKTSRDLFAELSHWEHRHEEVFSEMLQEVSEDQKAGMVDPNDEAALYLQSIVDAKVFPEDPAGQLTGKESPENVLEYALTLEKESILFYTGIRETTPNEAARDQIDQIVREEMRHVRILRQELQKSAQ